MTVCIKTKEDFLPKREAKKSKNALAAGALGLREGTIAIVYDIIPIKIYIIPINQLN